MKLYHHPLSGHAHRARLFLNLLGIDHELVHVDLAQGAHKQPAFLALNPFGQVPVLDDAGTIVADSNAILVYLAAKLGRRDWLPDAPAAAAQVQRWLSVAAGQIAYGPAAARLVTVFGAPFRPEEVIQRAHGILAQMEAALAGRDFLLGATPTVADVALYSYTARAPEGNVDLAAYPQVRAWLGRIEALPGFVAFERTPVGLAA
ncbi:glutathione S-transferase [Pseudorhodoferax aquiterrae]|uniref:Glutathione S-transferase n=1 Tax=Pseudorhodoferax aquiterrae TaxID=747304 RepID=A0ABQ3G0S7_9BURK|nr:glutathione S-transferase [Pseudorhodoferax aquiterrae]GHC78862.1 glutathione S-transferase [Pseudorhodoferax aquiterrae]